MIPRVVFDYHIPVGFVMNVKLTSVIWQQQQPFNGRLSGTTRVGRYQKKHSPAHTHPGQRTSFITFLHLQWSMASSLFSLRAWQSSQTTSFQVLWSSPWSWTLNFILRVFLHPIIIIFSQHMPICLFCCNINAMSSTPSLSLSSLLGSLSLSIWKSCLEFPFERAV